MTSDLDPLDGAQDRPGPTRRAVDELIRRSGVRSVASMEDLGRFRASLWDSDEELDAFLANVRAGRAGDASTVLPVIGVDPEGSSRHRM